MVFNNDLSPFLSHQGNGVLAQVVQGAYLTGIDNVPKQGDSIQSWIF